MEITIKEVEVTKLNLKPSDILVVKLKGDYVDKDMLDAVSNGFKKVLENAGLENQVISFAVDLNDHPDADVELSIVSEETVEVIPPKEEKKSYCDDCSCGKKACALE